ncbi:MAG: hypothetical protein WC924_02930 [Candidatus Gracilibacteria bacterium]
MKTGMQMLEIGNFEDLEHLVDLLNQTFKEMDYRLEKVPSQKGAYLFIEDPLQEDAYECGVIIKVGKKAYAYSSAVHEMILGAYQDYLEKAGQVA